MRHFKTQRQLSRREEPNSRLEGYTLNTHVWRGFASKPRSGSQPRSGDIFVEEGKPVLSAVKHGILIETQCAGVVLQICRRYAAGRVGSEVL